MTNTMFKKAVVMLVSAMSMTLAHADDAKLKIDGDLMIHPDQMASFFAIGADRIKNSNTWSWPAMQFTKPYRTSWNDVTAVGPFAIDFDTTNLAAQDVGITLTWKDPRINVGHFEIHDTLTRTVGGIPVIFHLDGTCNGMAMTVPGGQWKVHGRMRWDFASNRFVLSWENFDLQMNDSAQTGVEVGQCQGPADLFTALHDAVVSISHDRAWLQDVLQQGALDWLQTNMSGLQEQLLQARTIDLGKDISLAWQPAELSTFNGGMIRVAGQFTLSKPGARGGDGYLPRNYDAASVLAQVKESGFVMPDASLQKIMGYMYSNGILQYRAKSSDIASFDSLMNNRITEFFIWPDLMKFAFHTLFYFDITTSGEPQLTDGSRLANGGSVYNVTAPILVHQWAPSGNAYIPYIDFTSPAKGQMYAALKDNTLSITTRLEPLNAMATFRPEFLKTRSVDKRISVSTLAGKAKDFIEQTPFKVQISDFDFGSNLSVHVRDVQAYKDSFRIPLEFKSKPQ